MEIIDNTSKNRFETEVENKTAFIEYKIKDEKIYLTHTKVPKELEGQGIASSLVKEVFSLLEHKNLKMVPACSFIASYVKKHPEYEKLLA